LITHLKGLKDIYTQVHISKTGSDENTICRLISGGKLGHMKIDSQTATIEFGSDEDLL
jgi:hypothetical protein